MILPQSWYMRDVVEVACDLLGMQLRHGRVLLRITEVEAYLGPDDSACHTSMGRTARNAPMWGPGGHAYVYLCYGIHSMLNVVAGNGEGKAVLIRGADVIAGHGVVSRRRGRECPLSGPGKVGQALALTTALSGHALYEPGGLELLQGEPVTRVLSGPRVGISYASRKDQRACLRFADADSIAVSHRKLLCAQAAKLGRTS